jgi:RHS repeat-associated protein
LGLISRINANNQTSYYHYDFRGSTVAITDASQNLTHKYQYGDYGEVLQKQEDDFNSFRYVGKYGVAYEDSTHYFMRARYYDPEIGRFISEDPIWHDNLYPYADNNPVMGIDPGGQDANFERIRTSLEVLPENMDYVKTVINANAGSGSFNPVFSNAGRFSNMVREVISTNANAANDVLKQLNNPGATGAGTGASAKGAYEVAKASQAVKSSVVKVAGSSTAGAVVAATAILVGTAILTNEVVQINKKRKRENISWGKAILERPQDLGRAFDLNQYRWFPF